MNQFMITCEYCNKVFDCLVKKITDHSNVYYVVHLQGQLASMLKATRITFLDQRSSPSYNGPAFYPAGIERNTEFEKIIWRAIART